MAANSKIQWCDHTFQCVKCSPQGNRIVKAESGWKEPLKWDRAAKEACERHRVFCASLADVFEDWTGIMLDAESVQLWKAWDADKWKASADRPRPRWSPLIMQDVRNRLFRLIDTTPNLDWLLLTKRPENIAKMTYDVWCKRVPGHVSQNEGDGRRWEFPKNLWLGVSCENQQAADERIPILLRTPAAVRFLSCEPLLGPVVFDNGWSVRGKPWREDGQDINLVIVGGESGPKARPCRPEWIRSIVEQCKAASVPVFVKQMGGNIITRNDMIEDVFNDGESGWPDPQVEHNINGFREDHQGADCRIRLNDKKGGDSSCKADANRSNRMNAYNPDQFVRDNMPLAYSLARKYYLSYYGPQHGTHQAYEEFCSAALLGLVQASKKFDPSRGFKPTTYAWPAILREIINVQRKMRSDTILSGCGHKPKYHVPEVGFFSQRPREICDMDDGGFCLDDSQQQWELNEIRDEANALMGRLTERQKQIVRMRFFKGWSLCRIAKRIRVSRERVRQLIGVALNEMREAAGVG